MFPEAAVRVSGLKPEIHETAWLVKKAAHRIANDGFVTDLELEMLDDPTTDRHRPHFRKAR